MERKQATWIPLFCLLCPITVSLEKQTEAEDSVCLCGGQGRVWEADRKSETSAAAGDWVGVGWHNEWHIVKSLPTKQSASMQMRLSG